MQLEEALYSYLSGYAGLSSLVSNRVYPVLLPQDCQLPAVTYQRVSGPRVHCQGGDPGIAHPRIQVSCWAVTYSAARSIAAQVIAALQDFTGTMGGTGGVTVQASFLDDDADLYDPETQTYHVPVDFVIWHQE